MRKIFIKIALLCLIIPASRFSIAANFQDWWWNPEQSGMGINVGQQGKMIIAAWYLYGDDGQPYFLTLSGMLRDYQLEGALIRSTGPLPGPNFNPDAVDRTPVGTAKLMFKSEHEATFSYNYEGKKGTIALQRYIYKPPPLVGTWIAAMSNTMTNCTDDDDNGSLSDEILLTITQSGTKYKINTLDYDGMSCDIEIPLSFSGSILSGSGSLVCHSLRWRGTIQLDKVSMTGNDILGFEFNFRINQNETCKGTGTVLASRRLQ